MVLRLFTLFKRKVGKSMCSKLSITKKRVLQLILCLFFSFDSYSFSDKTFEKINAFFETVNSDLVFSKKDIDIFNANKIIT